MSYSFLSDAYPNWKEEKRVADSSSLYENFEASTEIKMPQPPKNHPTPKQQASGVSDNDLLTESFTDYNLPLETTNRGPQPFDTTSDYFKILSNDWNKDVSRYQANARVPFGPKIYPETNGGEEEQLGQSSPDCMRIAHHIDQCKMCRNRLQDIFQKLFSDKEQPKRQQQPQQNTFSTLADILLLVGIGLFVIFVLDGFVKLGRYIRS